MANRTVFITGITSGIGFETALQYATGGWHVAGQYFSAESKVNELVKKIANIRFIKADLSSEKGIEMTADEIAGMEIDSLINNAGTYSVSKHFSQLTLEEITATFMVNTFAPIRLCAAVFDKMKNKNFGRIVNISSIAAKYGGASNSMHYGCSKMAMEGITKTLAREGAAFNVLVNTVRPGVIDTDFHKKFPKDMKKRIEMIPMKKMGEPKDVAEMVYYLGSDKNKFITNEIITVSGGE